MSVNVNECQFTSVEYAVIREVKRVTRDYPGAAASASHHLDQSVNPGQAPGCHRIISTCRVLQIVRSTRLRRLQNIMKGAAPKGSSGASNILDDGSN